MSRLENSGKLPDDNAVEESSGPNLKLVYSLIALALLAALAVAALIVFPFYLLR
jgi:hypothetical protein